MVLSKLTFIPSSSSSSHIEFHDLRAALERVFLHLWGSETPIEIMRYMNGRLLLRAPSFPWRMEILWALHNIHSRLAEELPGHPPLSRITVLIGSVAARI